MIGMHKTLNWLGALALILLFSMAAEAQEALRTVRAIDGFQVDRPAGQRHDIDKAGEIAATPASEKGEAAPGTQAAACCSHYVYSGFTELFDDIDRDGYYTYLRINVDVDTDYYESDVYLKAFLRGSFGGWHKIYTSGVFTINGSSEFDDYEIETELVSGFAADHYDVLVEVYDAHSGQLLVEYGAYENSSFGLLPLEDVNRDGAFAPPIVNSYGSSGGGAVSPAALPMLALLWLTRRRRLRARSAAEPMPDSNLV